MRISDELLRGRTVIGADGRAIGEVTGVMIDSETWGVATLQIKLRREVGDTLGIHHRMFQSPVMELPIQTVQSVGDAVILSMSIENLRELVTPSPKHEHVPAPG